jgi:hypothetical protein
MSTFHRALNSNYGGEPIANIGHSLTSSFTTKKKGYYLNTNRTLKAFDTRGLESLSRKELEQVRAISDGVVGDDVEIRQKPMINWSIWDVLYAIMKRNSAAIIDPDCLSTIEKQDSIADIPHCVIFVIPANQRRVPNELRNFVYLFIERGYNPLFAVTKIDCHGAEEGDLYAATHLYDCKKEELLKLFGVNYDLVKPIQNYTQWATKEVSIENLALDLLSRATQVAEAFVLSLEQQEEDKFDWEEVFSCNIA